MKLQIIIFFLCFANIFKFKKTLKLQSKSLSKKKITLKNTLKLKEIAIPNRDKRENIPHLTDELPNQSGDGQHTFKQFQGLMQYRDLNFAQIKNIFNYADNDGDSLISDNEWHKFYDLFVEKFQKCDKDASNTLTEDEMKECILDPEGDFINLHEIALNEVHLDQMFEILGTKDINLYDYMYIRKFQNAIVHCSENDIIQINRIQCALNILSPKTKRLTAQQEKMIYNTAIILGDGYLYGQKNGLDLIEFLQVAHIYHYLADYEIQYDFDIRKDDILRAIQEHILPEWFTPYIVETFFQDMQKDSLSFAQWCGFYWSLRIYFKGSENTLNLSYDQFKALIDGHSFPDRFQQFIETTYIPSKEEYEEASSRIFISPNENQYFQKYSNIIFLQKKLTVQKKKLRKLDVDEPAKSDDDFPTEPERLIFNMYDSLRTEQIQVSNWLDFVYTSFTYISFVPTGFQKLDFQSFQNPSHMDNYIESQMNVFPMKINRRNQFVYTMDFLVTNQDYQLTLKEFLSFFRLEDMLENLKQPGSLYKTTVKRVIQGLHDLGLRFTEYNRKNSLEGYDSQLDNQNVQFKKSFMIAMKEDIVANRIKHNKPTVLVHKDHKLGE